ncbi:MAG TPA: caspase family protein, partial [Bacteroidia bacterium]|nr:caspase family protein [Bacteroidia bacterium]
MKRHTSPPPSLPVSEKQRPALLKRLLSGTILLAVGFGCLAQSVAQDRIALVVGIGDYQHIAKSGHAVASSRLVAEALKTAGYEVTALEDLDIARLDEALAAFREKVDRVAKAGLFYFAGHAIEYEGENYLLPTDVSADTAAQLKRQAVSLSATLKDLEATKLPAKMVVLDSCRENPLKGRPWLEDAKK